MTAAIRENVRKATTQGAWNGYSFRFMALPPKSKAIRNILLSFLAYLGLITVLCTGAYLEAHSTVILPMAYELTEEGEPVEGTDSWFGCTDDCLDEYDPFDVHDGDSIFFI